MYPPEVVRALQEALRNAYWYKNDLRLFLLAAEVPAAIVSKQGWYDDKEYKVRIVGKILDELLALGQEGLGPLRRLIQALLDIPNFDHLRQLEDGPAKVQAARTSIEQLRELVLRHDEDFRQTTEERVQRASNVEQAVKRRNDDIQRLQSQFLELAKMGDHQARGLLLETFLQGLFTAHDLDPRGSFRIAGEQIDGAFEIEGTQFLLEAKWVKGPLGAAPLDSFSRKVERKLENTLGLFLALDGYTDEGLTAFRGSRPSVILMDGADLAVVLQGLVDFRDLLKRKMRHAAQTGDPFLRARDIGA